MTPEEEANARLADAIMTADRMRKIANRNENLAAYFDDDIAAAHEAVSLVARAEQGRLMELIAAMKGEK